MMNEEKWRKAVEAIDFAFQPIVNINSGMCFGVEALLRDYNKAGFNSINDFFDTAYEEKILYKVELMLREKAIKKFIEVENYEEIKLFINIDNRLLEMADYSPGNTSKILKTYNISSNVICIEISERHEIKSTIETKSVLNLYKQQRYKIAIDDFGTGFSGLEMLYHSEPDFIKIDRFFISGIEKDFKKRLFISNIISMAHTLGIMVIAEGVEKKEEFYICRDIGCDFVQGYLIQRPTQNVNEIKLKNEETFKLKNEDKREKISEKEFIGEKIEKIESIYIDMNIADVFEIFKNNKEYDFFPVLSREEEPLGIIKEKNIKDYIFSPFGKEVLRKKIIEKNLYDFISECSSVETNLKIENILEIFSSDDNGEGIIVTENGKYSGFLTSKQLLKIIYEKKLLDARDQNPLTKMNGNFKIEKYLNNIFTNKSKNKYILCYFDFDSFKPFNDKYGFRQGDRAIIMFSELLNKYFTDENIFKGHIGGDDFFIGAEVEGKEEADKIHKKIKDICIKYKKDVAVFYETKDRENGFILSRDREGKKKKFKLLSVSAAVIEVYSDTDLGIEEISEELSKLKKTSKIENGGIAQASLLKRKKAIV